MLGLLTLVLLYLLFWPVPIDPAVWTPPAAPELGAPPYTQTASLAPAERVSTLPFGAGPEDIAVDSLGRVYGGLLSGEILRFAPDGTHPEVFAHTGGRPLGLAWDPAGNLIVADAHQGLLSIDPQGKIEVLTTAAGGRPFGFTDDVDIAHDGTIYFSDASDKFPVGDYRSDLLEHRPHGRLLAYHPATGETEVVLDSLYFANGVAVSPDQQAVLVTETSTYRVIRYWRAGPRAGQHEVLIDNLPGFPDGISTNGRDRYWIALANPRNPMLDAVLPHPFLRKIIVRLPLWLQPREVRYGLLVGLDLAGQVVELRQDPTGGFAPVTSVEEVDGMLYLGSLSDTAWARQPH
ncbi:MAG: SMP-30/gluconolactonase/LRE family protein [Bacteroidetes bacterium]|nr:MAG: SMP-30/gluconolactonase/LRE family protein [Bacteroidota bacterium]